ncbi:MAG: iron ABC transporter permease [Paenisporosarcina sp.]
MLNYRIQRIPYFIKLGMSLILMIVLFGMALVFGAADTSVRDVLSAIFSTAPNDQDIMLREIRFPREVAAALVGAALAVSGAIIQGMTRNPLADPGLLGLTAGANAALAISVAFWPSVNYFGVMMTCFVGAAAGAILVFGFSSFHPEGFTTLRIVLAGATISAFLYAIAEGIGIYFKISQQVSMWTAGGMIGTTWNQVQLIAPIVLVGVVISLMCARQLTILSLSEEMAVGLGQRVRLIKSILFVLVIILTGASVALVGNLAFFGLMVPHIVRAIVGTDYRFVLPMSAILGSAFMLLADTVARTINAPYETPVAAVVAIMGLPFFLYIVRKGGQSFS